MKTTITKNIRTIAVAALTALVFTAMPSQAKKPIKIGAIISKTGPAAFLGEPQDITLKHYVAEINKAGGVLGRPLELIIYDDTTSANKARTFATRLVEDDGVVAAIGASTTGGTLALAPVFEEAKIPLISLAAGIAIVEPARPYVFKTPHTDRMVCGKIISTFKARGFDKIALITGTGGVGKSMRKECTAAAAAQSIAIIADETFNPKDVDMTPQITKIKNTKGVDAIFVGGFGQSLAVVTRNFGQLGVKIPQYHSHGSASKTFIKLAGKASEGVHVSGPLLVVANILPASDPLKAAAVKYTNTFRKLTGKPVSTFGGYSYDALFLIVNAIKKAGSAKPSAIRDAIETTKNLPGVTGMFTMSPKDHLGIGANSLYMVSIKNGDWVLSK